MSIFQAPSELCSFGWDLGLELHPRHRDQRAGVLIGHGAADG